MNFLIRCFLTLLVIVAITYSSQATNYTWTGTTSTAWSTATNWNPTTGVPGSADNVTIPTVSSGNYPVVSSSLTITNLTMTGGALTINSSAVLTTTGTVTISGGTVTISSGSSYTASGAITISSGTLTCNGTVALNGTTKITGSSTAVNGSGTLAIGTSTTSVSTIIGAAATNPGPSISVPSTIYALLGGTGSFFYNTTFSASLSVTYTGSAASSQNGGNTFSGTTSIWNQGTVPVYYGYTAGETFTGDVTFSTTGGGSGYLYLSYNNYSNSYGNIILGTVSSPGITFGAAGTPGTSTMASGKTISVGTSLTGQLTLNKFTQSGSTAQSLSGTGNVTLGSGTTFNGNLTLSLTGTTADLTFGSGSTFVGTVTATAPILNLNGADFKNIVNVTQTNGNGGGTGGNTFEDTVYITATAGVFHLNTTSADSYQRAVTYTTSGTGNMAVGYLYGNTYSGDVTFNSNSSAIINASYNGTTSYNGNLILACGGAGITFGGGTGTSTLSSSKTITVSSYTGPLIFTNFTHLGSSAVNFTGSASLTFGSGTTFSEALTISLSGTSLLTFSSGSTFNGSISASVSGTTGYVLFHSGSTFAGTVSASAPIVYLNGAHFKNVSHFVNVVGGVNCTGGNTFDSAAYITLSGTGGLNMNTGSRDVFNSNVTYTSTGSGSMFIGQTKGNTYNGNVIFSSHSGVINASDKDTTYYNGNIFIRSVSGTGITFGNNSGLSTLASGKTISADTLTAPLTLSHFTQSGSTAQSLSGSANLTFGTGTTFNGLLTINLSGTAAYLNFNTLPLFASSVTATAPYLQLNGGHFKGITNLTQNGGTSTVYSSGGNIFDSTIFINSYTGSLRLNNGSADTYNRDVTYTTGSSALLTLICNSHGNTYNGNVTYVSNSSNDLYVTYTSTNYYNGNISVKGTTPQNVVFNAGGSAVFSGLTNQYITDSASTGITFACPVTVNKSSGSLTLNSPVSISGTLTLTLGNINTTSTNILTMNVGSSTSSASALSYVNGPMIKKGNTAFTFPIGASGHYAPIGISTPTNSYWYTAQYFRTVPPPTSPVFTSPLKDISACEYWSLKANTASSLAVTLSWDSSKCSLNNYNVFQVAGSNNGGNWTGLGGNSITSSYTTGSMTSNSFTVPTTVEYLTFGYNSKLILNTTAVNSTAFTVSGADYFPSTVFTSGTTGSSGGKLLIHPNLSANTTLYIQPGTNNAADTIQVGINSSAGISAVNGIFNGTYYPMSPSYYTISSDTLTFAKSASVSPSLAVSTNLINGLLYDHTRLTSGFQVTVPGFANVTLKIINASGSTVYTSSNNTWPVGAGSPVSGSPYQFQVIVNGSNVYTGQLLYR